MIDLTKASVGALLLAGFIFAVYRGRQYRAGLPFWVWVFGMYAVAAALSVIPLISDALSGAAAPSSTRDVLEDFTATVGAAVALGLTVGCVFIGVAYLVLSRRRSRA